MAKAKKKVPKKKLEVVFDEKKRREFLTGFQKRKNERRKRAKDELERNIKAERKRIREEIKNGLKHMKKSFEPLKELTEEDKAVENEYEDNDVKVKIIELSTNELAARSHLMGDNRGGEESESDVASEGEVSLAVEDVNYVPGMNLNGRTNEQISSAKSEKNSSENKVQKDVEHLKSKKELDRLKKTKVLKKLKQSKIFQQKKRLEARTNQKKARRDKNNTLRSLPKNVRKRKKFEPNRYSKGRLNRINNKKQLRKKSAK